MLQLSKHIYVNVSGGKYYVSQISVYEHLCMNEKTKQKKTQLNFIKSGKGELFFKHVV